MAKKISTKIYQKIDEGTRQIRREISPTSTSSTTIKLPEINLTLIVIMFIIALISGLVVANTSISGMNEEEVLSILDDYATLEDLDSTNVSGSTTTVINNVGTTYNQSLNTRDNVNFSDITIHGSSNFTGDVREGVLANSPEVRIGHHGAWDSPVVFFDDGSDEWGIDMLVGGILRFFVPTDVIMSLTTTQALIDVPLDVTGLLDVTGDVIADNMTTRRNMTVGDNLYLSGILDMGADGFRVSPTDTGASIRFEIGVGGDISMAGTFTNDGNLRILGDSYLGNGPTDDTYVNGTLHVDGDVIVSENITGNFYYAEGCFHKHTGDVLSFTVADKFYTLPYNYTKLNGFTCIDNANFTCLNAGMYLTNFVAAGSGQNNHEYILGVAINGVVEECTAVHEMRGAGADVSAMSGTGIIRLAEDDVVSLMIKDWKSTGAGVYHTSNFNLVRIGN